MSSHLHYQVVTEPGWDWRADDTTERQTGVSVYCLGPGPLSHTQQGTLEQSTPQLLLRVQELSW